MAEEIKDSDKMTAVIIADSFTRAFWPITNDIPKALIPLCNIPMIEYTIELVIRNHIKKIIIFCSSQAKKVIEYLQTQKYRQVAIQVMTRKSCISLGDVMRELDSKKILNSDFMIIFGDTVGNANLKEAIDHHKALREKQKDFILTVVFSELPVESKLRTLDEQCIVVLENSRILQYDATAKKKNIELNSNVKFKELRELEIRCDLVESGVLVCSPEIMHYFSDEFDYHSLRDHLMRDILTSEIYNDKFSAYILPKHQYLHRVHVPRVYDAISVDIMNRWLYPICLEANLFPPSTPSSYKSFRNNLYKESKVQLAKNVSIEIPAVIGTGTQILEDTQVSMSGIGRNCKIGKGCMISNSYIWDNVHIGNNCKISHSIICNNVSIGDNCVILSGSVVSINVKIKNDQTIPELSRISLYKYNKALHVYQLSQDESEIGQGFFFDASLESKLHGFTEQLLITQSIGGHWHAPEISNANSNDSESDSSGSSEDQPIPEKFMSKEKFIEEIKALVSEMIELEEGVGPMQTEINSLKLSHNKDIFGCISGLVQGIVESCKGRLSEHFKKWVEILLVYTSSDNDKSHLLKELENCLAAKNLCSQFHLVVKVLYEDEVVDGDCIIAWFNFSTNEQTKALMKTFIEWLQEDSEEEEDED